MTNLIDLSKLNVSSVVKVNKVLITEKIFVENYLKVSRKEIITQFMSCEAKMTFAGASTYYQNFKKKYDNLIKLQQESILNEVTESVEQVVE
jgi:hypothetical protein